MPNVSMTFYPAPSRNHFIWNYNVWVGFADHSLFALFGKNCVFELYLRPKQQTRTSLGS